MGRVKVNYRLRDAIFSRQRYWGEPFPVYYKDGMPYMISEDKLPLELPEIDQYKPTETGEPPLGHAKKWAWDTEKNEVVDKSLIDNKTVFPLELNTMPGFAGSSAYYLRYMDPHNDNASWARRPTTTGRTLTCMWAEQSTPRATLYTHASGTSSCSTSVCRARRSLTRSSSTRV